MCDSKSVFRVQGPSSGILCFWNYQGREVLVYSLIDDPFPRHSNLAITISP